MNKMTFIKEIVSFIRQINRQYFFDYFTVLFLALVLFSWLQSPPTLPEPDSFYHTKIAQFISQGEILHQFPWLQETGLKDKFVDHHFLYHLLLVPFANFYNPLVGVKVATVIFASLLVLTIYWLLKQFQVKWPLLFVIILLTIHPWLFRAGLVKAPAVFLILFFIAFYSLIHQKKLLLFLVSFASVWTYAGWPLLLIMSVLYLLVTVGVEKLREQQSFYLKLKYFFQKSFSRQRQSVIARSGLKFVMSGLVAGLIINPYFPVNLSFYWQQFIKIAVVNYQNVIGVGGEWYPYSFLNLLADAPLACSLLLVSFLIFILTFKKQSTYSWTWGILSMAFFLLTLKSRRYVELYVPFTIIFSAFCLSDFIKDYSWQKVWSDLGRVWRLILSLLVSVILLGFITNVPHDLKIVKRDMANGLPLTYYQKLALWLKQNTPKESIVFQADWDDFPALFYYNDHNYYLTGLDPTFMYEHNRERYWQYVKVTLGRDQQNLGEVVHNQFKADYLFLDKKHQVLDNALKYQLDFKLVYEDEEGKIYQYLSLNDKR